MGGVALAPCSFASTIREAFASPHAPARARRLRPCVWLVLVVGHVRRGGATTRVQGREAAAFLRGLGLHGASVSCSSLRPSARQHTAIRVAPLLYHRMLCKLAPEAMCSACPHGADVLANTSVLLAPCSHIAELTTLRKCRIGLLCSRRLCRLIALGALMRSACNAEKDCVVHLTYAC